MVIVIRAAEVGLPKLRRNLLSKSEVLGEAKLPPSLLNMPYDALRAALRGNRPKAVKEAILGEMRRREAQEGRESLAYNGGMGEDG